MFGRRRNASRAPAPDAASQALAYPRDEWRTLPPLPTIMRTSALTLAPDAFRDSLRSWHNPSFLAPLSHQIDDSGPIGRIAGLATTSASQQSSATSPDHPLAPADGGGAPVQRTVASWAFPSPPRQSLVLAPEPELEPVPIPVVPALAAEAGASSGENATVTSQEPEPANAADPAASVTPERRQEAPAAEVRPAAPTSRPAEAATLGQPPSVQREPADVTTQRQPSQASRQAPPRRLGLGAPLSDLPGGPAARPAPTPPDLPVARLPSPAASAGPGRQVPGVSAPARLGSDADPAPLERSPGLVAGSLTGRAETVEPGQVVFQRSSGPGAGDQLGQVVHRSQSEAPLLSGQPLVMRNNEPWTGPAADAAQRATSVPAGSPLPSAPPGPPVTAPTRVQRLASPPPDQGGGLARSPAGLRVTPQLPEGRGPAFSGLTPQRPAGQSGPASAGEWSATSKLPSAAAVALTTPDHTALAPLVGQRGPAPTLSTSFHAPPGPVAVQAAGAPGVRAEASAAPVPPGVQRSVAGPTVASSRSGHAPVLPGGPAYREHPPALGADPGAIAIARGIAHRDSDGSVVFDLSPPPVVSRSISASTRHERPAEPDGAGGPPDIVQRADVPAGSSDGSAGDGPFPAGSPVMSAPPAAAASPAPAAQASASPPLDELARQLFDPLAARLKAELRLDRERAGLLTDMRQ